MATGAIDIDSSDALHAFRVAMGLNGSNSTARHAEPSVHSQNVLRIEPPVKGPAKENQSNEEARSTASDAKISTETGHSIVIRCLNCGQEMEGILTTGSAPQILSKILRRENKDDALDLSLPSNQKSTVPNFEVANAKIEIGRTRPSLTKASTAKQTHSTNVSVPHDNKESSRPSPAETPNHHRAIANMVAENESIPVNAGLRVPQNSPAYTSTALPGPVGTPSNTTDDPFTREEAHDVVIGIFKELAALSKKVKAKDSATDKSRILEESRQSKSISVTKPSRANADPPDGKMKPQEISRSFSADTPKSIANTSHMETFGSNENSPPHVRVKEHRKEMASNISPSEDAYLLPHVRISKHNIEKSSAVCATANYYSVLDLEHHSSISHQKEIDDKEGSELHATEHHSSKSTGRRSTCTSSSGSSNTSIPNPKEDGADAKPDPEPKSVSPAMVLVEPTVDKGTTNQKGPSSQADILGSKAVLIDKVNSTMQTDLAPWFLEKYASKKRAMSSNTIGPNAGQPENLEGQVILKAWTGQAERSRPVAGIRTCNITQIPTSATPAFVCSLVFGGALEYIKIQLNPDSSTASATVKFFSIVACKRFYEDTANGLPFRQGSGSPERIALVTLGKDVDVIGGLLAQQIEQGVTRCVRAVPVDASLDAADLFQLAVDKGRHLEGFEDSEGHKGTRSVIWRFCDVAHAVAFRGVLARNQDFESCNITFSADPCAMRDRVKRL